MIYPATPDEKSAIVPLPFFYPAFINVHSVDLGRLGSLAGAKVTTNAVLAEDKTRNTIVFVAVIYTLTAVLALVYWLRFWCVRAGASAGIATA